MQVLLLALLISFSQYSLATVYKCKNNTGKTTYSESPCSSSAAVVDLYEDQNVIDNSHLRKKIQSDKAENTSKEKTTISDTPALNYMSAFEIKNRLREISVHSSLDMPFEVREDAKNEYRYIFNRQPKRLSYELEINRTNAKTELTSPVLSTRTQALSKLRAIYTNY